MKTTPSKGYKVWHLALAVPAIALVLQVVLGPLTPVPQDRHPYNTQYASAFDGNDTPSEYYDYAPYQGMPEIEILPLNLRGEMTGPLLASVIKQYFPESTAEQASDLCDTLPPCDDPRMIVILPKDDEPVF